MQLHLTRDQATSHPPANSMFDDQNSGGCRHQACCHRRWRVCGRPGCAGLRAYPQLHHEASPDASAREAGTTS